VGAFDCGPWLQAATHDKTAAAPARRALLDKYMCLPPSHCNYLTGEPPRIWADLCKFSSKLI
jgi:hypothetical protein